MLIAIRFSLQLSSFVYRLFQSDVIIDSFRRFISSIAISALTRHSSLSRSLPFPPFSPLPYPSDH